MACKKLSCMLAILLIPNLANCQITNTMAYRIINGRVYVEAPTTTPPSFLQSMFPFLSSSYQSSNSEEVDEAIINSVSGPPAPIAPESGGVLSLPSFSASYPPEVNHNQIGSPYLPDDDYAGSDNQYQYAMPPVYGPKNPGYPSPNSIYSNLPPPMSYSNAGPTGPSGPYPTMVPVAPTTERSVPFYQPLLDFFGWGSPAENDVSSMLPSPTDILSMGSFPSDAIPSIPQTHGYVPAQARHSFVMNPYINEEEDYDHVRFTGDAAEPEGPSSTSDESAKKPEESKDDAGKDKTSADKKFPCPTLGNWQWDGENCIAIGPVPAWGCKPNDLATSGRIAICRNKIFFPYGVKPLEN